MQSFLGRSTAVREADFFKLVLCFSSSVCVFFSCPPGSGCGTNSSPGLHSSFRALAGVQRRWASHTSPFKSWKWHAYRHHLWRGCFIRRLSVFVLVSPNMLICAVNRSWPACVVFPLICFLEKGKRAKSGSAGEASSSSHSERSNSFGSLKGTGKKKQDAKHKGAVATWGHLCYVVIHKWCQKP